MDMTTSVNIISQGSSSVGKRTTKHLSYSPPAYGDPSPRYSAKSIPATSHFDESIGDDKLPPYTSTLQLLTLCRRKHLMESTNRKAKRRHWDIVWLLLDGTALRIYTPTSDEKKKFIKEWKERYCTKIMQNKKAVACSVATEDPEEMDEEEEFEEPMEVQDDTHACTGTSTVPARQPLQNRGRSSSIMKAPVRPTQPPVRRSTLPLINTRTNAFTSRSGAVFDIPAHPSLPSILSRKAHKSYPVRNATCARPSSYFKRNFVAEFTLDGGKKFLIQLNDYEELLTWFQVMTIATPLALDLDERPMPAAAAYPRPRRRRPQTAPANIDVTTVPNIPPSYATTNPPTESAPVRSTRRSLDI